MEILDPLKRRYQRRHARLRTAVKQLDRSVDRGGSQFRFIPLHIDDYVRSRQSRQRLDDAGCAARGIWRGHHRLSAKSPHGVHDFVAVGYHDHLTCPGGAPGGPPGVFDERAARLGQQHLAGKPLAGEPGWNHNGRGGNMGSLHG